MSDHTPATRTVRAHVLRGDEVPHLRPGDPLVVPGTAEAHLRPDEHEHATVVSVTRRPIRLLDDRGIRADTGPPAGHHYKITYRTAQGSVATVTAFDSERALLAEHPRGVSDHHDAARDAYLHAWQTTPLRVPNDDSDGDEVALAPTWGARVTVTVFAPGAQASDLAADVQAALDGVAAAGTERVHVTRVEEVVDVRVDIFGPDGDEPAQTGVLAAEAGFVAGPDMVAVRPFEQ